MDPKLQALLDEDDLKENENDGLGVWYKDLDDPHEPEDDEVEDTSDHPRM